MKARRFAQLDVFGDEPLRGNALAVVLDAEGLGDAQMAAFARWTNLSETAFLLPPTDAAADYRVRIFTPTVELPFAGHPTLGSCHAWLAAGGRPRRDDELVQQCGIGLVRLRRDGARLAFAAPPRRRSGPLDVASLERIARLLGVSAGDIVAHQHCDNGPAWQAVLLSSAEQVRALRPQLDSADEMEVGVVGPESAGAPTAFEVRAFFPAPGGGLIEDPVTGSLNAALAQWLIASGRAAPQYVAAQGSALGRAGRVHVEQRGADIWIGGRSVGIVEGSVRL